MAEQTKIQWCDHTWNPWRGCAKPAANPDGTGIAPECFHCYAESQAARSPAVLGGWGRNAVRAIGAKGYWDHPLAWNDAARRAGVRRRVFFASMADVFEDRDDLVEHRERAFDVIDRCDHLDFLALTKRPEMVPLLWPGGSGRRRDNVWLGTSCGAKSSLWRIDALRDCASLASLLFVSAEPLLEAVDFGGRLDGVSWLILGGESGPKDKARPLDIAWIRSAIADARNAPGDVAVFVKQLGTHVEACDGIDAADYFPGGVRLSHGSLRHNARVWLDDPKGGDPAEWPANLRVREMPRAAEGAAR